MTRDTQDDALRELGRAFDALQETEDTTIDSARRAAFVQRAQEIPMIRRREMIATVTLGAVLATGGVVLATSNSTPTPAAPPDITIQTHLETPIQLSPLQQAPAPTKRLILEPDSEPFDGPASVLVPIERGPEPPFIGPAAIVKKPPRAVPVYMVGVYETPLSPLAGYLEVREDAEVTLDVDGDAVLVLSAYRGTRWNVTVGQRTNLREIVVNGYDDQAVVEVTHAGPMAGERIPVPVRTLRRALGTSFPTFHTWTPERPVAGKLAPHIYKALDHQGLAARRIGAPITHFYGCYRMDSIHIGSSGVRAHSCDERAGYALDVHHLK